MKRKNRQIKKFIDKFGSDSKKLNSAELHTIIYDKMKKNSKLTIKDILVELNLYKGVFYIKPSNVNFKMLNLNLENVYQKLVPLKKQLHNDNDWAYSNNEFQKVYVLNVFGNLAIVLLEYNDPFCELIVDEIFIDNIELEGNIAYNLV